LAISRFTLSYRDVEDLLAERGLEHACMGMLTSLYGATKAALIS
jgi:hypothetical protein